MTDYTEALKRAALEVRTTATVLAQIEAQGSSVTDDLLSEWLDQHERAFDAARAAERALVSVALGQL